MHGIAPVIISLLLALVLRRFIEFRKAVRAVNSHPGYRLLFNTLGPVENFFPRILGVTAGNFHMWRRKHMDFEIHGWDVISYVTAFFGSKTNFYVADAEAIKEITTHRARFPKPTEQYKLLTYFGGNIITTEGEEWKRFRKIVAPAFSERNNKLVWDESVHIVGELFQRWGSQKEVAYQHVVDLTLPTALFVIGVAGFGRRVSWEKDVSVPPGHRLNFKDALHTVAAGVFTRLLWPQWMLNLGLTTHHRKVKMAFDELQAYMHEMIRERRSTNNREMRHDLFSSLLDANDVEDSYVKLQDNELIGNTFIFLLAGHETTAHTLCYALALLALHAEKQRTLYEEMKRVVGVDTLPGYENMNALTYCYAVLNETLRLFPPVHSIPKSVAEDTTITVTNAAGEKAIIPLPRGSNISLHTPGLHYNPRYWADPYRFHPERFLRDDWPRDAFIPFSAGPRACLGRRFSETESIAVLTMLILHYQVEIIDEPEFADETLEERKERVLRSKSGVSMTPIRVPLVFKRRTPIV